MQSLWAYAWPVADGGIEGDDTTVTGDFHADRLPFSWFSFSPSVPKAKLKRWTQLQKEVSMQTPSQKQKLLKAWTQQQKISPQADSLPKVNCIEVVDTAGKKREISLQTNSVPDAESIESLQRAISVQTVPPRSTRKKRTSMVICNTALNGQPMRMSLGVGSARRVGAATRHRGSEWPTLRESSNAFLVFVLMKNVKRRGALCDCPLTGVYCGSGRLLP